MFDNWDWWARTPAVFTAAAITGAAIQRLWRTVFVPLWAAMKAAVKLTEIHETVQDIHDQFGTGSGHTLAEVLDRYGKELEELRAVMFEHLHPMPGGRRSYDPPVNSEYCGDSTTEHSEARYRNG